MCRAVRYHDVNLCLGVAFFELELRPKVVVNVASVHSGVATRSIRTQAVAWRRVCPVAQTSRAAPLDELITSRTEYPEDAWLREHTHGIDPAAVHQSADFRWTAEVIRIATQAIVNVVQIVQIGWSQSEEIAHN